MPERKNDAKAEGLSHKKEAARPLDKRKKKRFSGDKPEIFWAPAFLSA